MKAHEFALNKGLFLSVEREVNHVKIIDGRFGQSLCQFYSVKVLVRLVEIVQT